MKGFVLKISVVEGLAVLACLIGLALFFRWVFPKMLEFAFRIPKGMWIRDKKGNRHYVRLKKGPDGRPVIESVKPTPSLHGENCLGNGEYKNIARQCDNCDHYLTCFPDWKDE